MANGNKPAKKQPAPTPVAPTLDPMDVVVLKVSRLNANRVMCEAGFVIAPNVDGWSEKRVGRALAHGYAEVTTQ